MKEEIKNNALSDEELNEVAGGDSLYPEPTNLMWCEDCKKNVRVPILSLFCPDCEGSHLSEPRT